MMRKAYRKGAMMDEYERAASELRSLVEQIPDDEFGRIVDLQSRDEDCRSQSRAIAGARHRSPPAAPAADREIYAARRDCRSVRGLTI
jgi:hypothetical protein